MSDIEGPDDYEDVDEAYADGAEMDTEGMGPDEEEEE